MNNYDQHLNYDEVFSILHGETLIINKKKVDNIKDLVQTVNLFVKQGTRKINIQVLDNKNNKIFRTTTYRKIKSRSESRESDHKKVLSVDKKKEQVWDKSLKNEDVKDKKLE